MADRRPPHDPSPDEHPLGVEFASAVLSADISMHDQATVVYLTGDLDVAGALTAEGVLRDALADAQDRGVGAVHVDLTGVGLVDSSGLSALVQARRDTREALLVFAVVDASPSVRRMLAITRLDEVFGLPASA